MDAQLISAIVGAGLSLALSYIPGLAGEWEKLPSDQKRAFMGFLILVTAAGAYLGVAYGLVDGPADWRLYVEAALSALVANQGMYQITKG